VSNTDQTLLEAILRDRFSNQFQRLLEPWEQCAWFQSYKVELASGSVLYVKGTPRSRAEAYITEVLHRCAPGYVPAMLVKDLLPTHPWHWFLLEDGGISDHTAISVEDALQAAFCLGSLQRLVCQHLPLAKALPQCRAEHLQDALLGICDWALYNAPVERQPNLLAFQHNIRHATSYFRTLHQHLARLPDTCIHGDFWSGNIAFRNGTACLIDWGDSLWGVGSVSIVNLLTSESGTLLKAADAIWEAYASGWERHLTPAFMEASQVAFRVSCLVVDIQIAKCCLETVDILPGLLVGLQELADLWN
jgi:hypothetical protein